MADKTTFAHEFFEFSVKDNKLYLYDNLDKQYHIVKLVTPEIKPGLRYKLPAYLAHVVKQ